MAQQPSPRVPRGRPREFDTDAAVERAMVVFWSCGSHGTSPPDLLEATALSRGSLYAAFGDKHGLFLRALDRYIEDALAQRDQRIKLGADALAGVRTCLAGYVARTSGSAGKRGCLGSNLLRSQRRPAREPGEIIRRFFRALETRL